MRKCTFLLLIATLGSHSSCRTYDAELDDFLIRNISGIANDPSKSMAWFIYRNGNSLTVGGCRLQAAARDSVAFKYEKY